MSPWLRRVRDYQHHGQDTRDAWCPQWRRPEELAGGLFQHLNDGGRPYVQPCFASTYEERRATRRLLDLFRDVALLSAGTKKGTR